MYACKDLHFTPILQHRLCGRACSGHRHPSLAPQVFEGVILPFSGRVAARLSGWLHGGFLPAAGFPRTRVTSVRELVLFRISSCIHLFQVSVWAVLWFLSHVLVKVLQRNGAQ